MLINEAYAQNAGAAAPGGDMTTLLLMVAMFAVFYFLMIRPQMKRAKELKTLLEGLQKGDEIVTSGGQVGRITKVGGNYVVLEIADNVEVIVQKVAVQTLLPKGTMKSVEKE